MREPYKQAFEQKHPGDKVIEWDSAARSNYANAIDRADHAARMR
jgi:hypothetical protein